MFLNDFVKKFSNINLRDLSEIQTRKGFDVSSLNRIEESEVVICLGYEEKVYTFLKPWLQKGRTLIFLEEENRCFFNVSKSISEDIRVEFFTITQEDETNIKEVVWKCFALKSLFVCHPELISLPIHSYVKKTFSRLNLGTHLVISDVADFGKKAFQNILRNSVNIIAKKGDGLKNAFEKVPAIICGAGPSIGKEIEKIAKIKERALVFAGGSALNVLAKKGVSPHFGGGVDKSAPFEKFQTHLGFLTPFLYQMRVSSQNFSLIHHEPVCFGESPEALFSDFLEDCYQLPSFSSGWCVGNFLSSIAVYMGCDPIIFIGMDFSYTKGNKYADSKYLGGEEKVIQKDFAMAKEYTIKLEKKYPDRRFINASSWGSSSFSDALKLCDEYKDIEGLIHQRLQECSQLDDSKRVLEDLYASFIFCQSALAKDFLAGEKIIKEQMAFLYIISPIWKIFAPLIFAKKKEQMNEKEKKMHQYVFFQKVIDIYIKEIEREMHGTSKI